MLIVQFSKALFNILTIKHISGYIYFSFISFSQDFRD